MLKVELHTHTHHDPLDRIPHSSRQLIDRAASLGYHALAITLHDRFHYAEADVAYAREKGLLLISGIERTISGKHVLLINFPPACGAVQTFDDIRALKARCRGLVIAPHPFYPIQTSLGSRLEANGDVFDAVEYNAMYTQHLNFNRRAVAWAKAHGKPLVGNTDLHRLEQLGTTWSVVDAEATAEAICAAIRAGRVQVESQPLTMAQAALTMARMTVIGALGRTIGTRNPSSLIPDP